MFILDSSRRGIEAIALDTESKNKAFVLLLAIIVGLGLGVLVAASSPLYVVGGLAGLALGIALLINTQIGMLTFVVVATLLPYAVVPVPLGGVKPTFIDAVLTTMLLVWLVRLLIKADTRLETTHLGGTIAILLLLAVTSYFIGTAYGTTAGDTRLFVKLINSILLFFTTVNCVRTRGQLQQIFSALMIGGAAAGLIGIVLYFLPTTVSTRALTSLHPLGYYQGAAQVLQYIANTNTMRAISTAVDPNVLGVLLMVSLALVASQLLSAHPLLRKPWLLTFAAPLAVCLLLTFSRGSWVGFIAAILFMAIIKYRRLWLLFVAVAVLLYFGTSPGDVPYLNHLMSGFALQDKSAQMRIGEYKDALQLISSYPLFGVGFGSAPSVGLYVGVSSIYLLIAEEMGLIGLAVYLLIMALFFINTLKRFGGIADPQLQSIVLGLTAAVVSALVAGIFDHQFFDVNFPHVVALFWLLVGLVLAGLKISANVERV